MDEQAQVEDTGPVYHHTTQNARGTQDVCVTLTEDADQREKKVICAPQWVIPIILLPGVIGTNLKEKNKSHEVWRAPNSTLAGLPMLMEFFFKGAAARQMLFNPQTSEVDWDGPVDAGPLVLGKDLQETEDILRQRGWGSLFASSYHPLLQTLHQRLNDGVLVKGTQNLGAWWKDTMMQDPKLWGSVSSGDTALTEDEIKNLVRYRFDIWACGYNWLKSNAESANQVNAYIKKVLALYAKDGTPSCKKVIVVTHSMGGLVLRGLLQIAGAADNILGVVHGVQPAAGAPSVYKRARAGFETLEQIVLGRNAAQALPVIANAPSLLEMLPFKNYNDGKPWLKVKGNDFALPKEGNPYKEIYGSTAWYGLIPEQNTKLIDPAGTVATRIGPGKPIRGAWFNPLILDVANFHQSISTSGKEYHPVTYAHCGIDGKHKTWGEVLWTGQVPPGAILDTATLTQDDLDSSIELAGALKLTLEAAKLDGDGTVPALSGLAPQGKALSMFVHGQGTVPGNASLDAMRTPDLQAPARQEGYDHQDSYLDKRGQWTTLYAIAKIAQKADWAQP